MWATSRCVTLTDKGFVSKVNQSVGAQDFRVVDVTARLHTVRYILYTGCECDDVSDVRWEHLVGTQSA